MSATSKALWIKASSGRSKPRPAHESSSGGASGARWNGMPNISPNTKSPRIRAQKPPMPITMKRFRRSPFFILIAETTPSSRKKKPYPTSPIMKPKKNGNAMNMKTVGSSSW